LSLCPFVVGKVDRAIYAFVKDPSTYVAWFGAIIAPLLALSVWASFKLLQGALTSQSCARADTCSFYTRAGMDAEEQAQSKSAKKLARKQKAS
jgi:hypothetical protein